MYSREKSDPVFDTSDSTCCAILKETHRIIIVEGNYLLLGGCDTNDSASGDANNGKSYMTDTSEDMNGAAEEYNPESVSRLDSRCYAIPLWHHLESLFSEKWYLHCENIAQQKERLMMRHLETWTAEKDKLFGTGIEGAGRKADSNDILNAINIEKCSRDRATRVILSVNE